MAKKNTRRRTVTRQGISRPEDTGETLRDLEKRLEKAAPAPPVTKASLALQLL
jgi:hypothetical protein